MLSEMFNLYGTLDSGKDYTWDNALGATMNVWAGPQVGAFGVTATQLIPIIGRINALQHGTAGPEFLRDISRHQAGRYLIYALATPLLTLPQYDFVMTLMANVPNGKGILKSGIADCIKKFGRPCVGGPTSVLYEASGHSPLAFVPLAVSAATQLALLLYLKKCATGARVVPEGKSRDTSRDTSRATPRKLSSPITSEGQDYTAIELQDLTPSKLDFRSDTKRTPSKNEVPPDSDITSPSRISLLTRVEPGAVPAGDIESGRPAAPQHVDETDEIEESVTRFIRPPESGPDAEHHALSILDPDVEPQGSLS